jgi:FlaA1/EpsC-like NDP-sugar epimerase
MTPTTNAHPAGAKPGGVQAWTRRFSPEFRRVLSLLWHMILALAALWSAFLLRFEGRIPPGDFLLMVTAMPLALAVKGLSVHVFKLQADLSRYVSLDDLVRLLKAATVGSGFFMIGTVIVIGHPFPRSVFIIDYILTIAFYAASRVFLQVSRDVFRHVPEQGPGRRTLILGAGDTGEATMRMIKKDFYGVYAVVGFLDDDPMKWGMTLHGCPIRGPLSDAPRLIKDLAITEVIIAIPSATKEFRRRIVERCAAHNVTFKILPAMRDTATGEVQFQRIRQIDLSDLLGREPIILDKTAVAHDLAGKCVLVTGAGGSIGSELVRQIARHRPGMLVLLDTAETPLFQIDREMETLAPKVRRAAVFADVKHGDLIQRVFHQWSPDVVYHAAAYKHVPMMEAHPVEAVFNNVFGTRNLALAAVESKVRKFVMISTDKAVHPTSVMGATKRCAELLTAHMNGQTTKFVAVRFGNVLGSAGSVVPIFERQIAEGGPVLVTHPDVMRYFMTIPEAVELVLQAGVKGEGGEVFILEMGEQIRIADLARNMIGLAGLEPGKDLEIRFTGLRPGEKLYEETVAEGEDVQPTGIPKVKVHRVPHPSLTTAEFLQQLKPLEDAAFSGDDARTRDELWSLIKQYDGQKR